MSGLCFSELSDDELNYTIHETKRLLKTGGLLLIADEVIPENIFKRILSIMFRFPLVIITYILTQTTTRAVKELPEKVKTVGFEVRTIKRNIPGNFLELVSLKS